MNARISNFILPETGTYTIRALGNGESRGNYTIALAAGVMPSLTPEPPTPGPTPTPVVETLTLGRLYEGRILPRSSGNRYHLQIDGPMLVELRLELEDGPANIDLDLRPPDGRPRALTGFGLTTSLVFLPDLFSGVSGRVRLCRRQQRASADPLHAADPGQRPDRRGRRRDRLWAGVSGELMFSGQQDHWTFEGKAGTS
jgi:hypothetical protein